MFKKNKWDVWYQAQPEHIQRWIDQPKALWYDSDMWRAGLFGALIGLLIGLAV